MRFRIWIYKYIRLRNFVIIIASIVLQGCVSSDILVIMDNHPEPLKGMATATLMSGTFYAEDSKGLLCSGVYDSRNADPKLHVSFRCSDSRSGNASIERYGEYLKNGYGQGILNDGTIIHIYLGFEIERGKANH